VRGLRDDGRVRYDGAGGLCVPLWDASGDLVNVVTRQRDPGDGPKVTGMRGCPTLGTLVDRVQDIARGSAVILTEGVADALTAASKWRSAVILGAHGAGRMADIAIVAAPRVMAAGGGASPQPGRARPGLTTPAAGRLDLHPLPAPRAKRAPWAS
jgi:hypothetical protein